MKFALFYTFFVRFGWNLVHENFTELMASFMKTGILEAILYLRAYTNFCPYFPRLFSQFVRNWVEKIGTYCWSVLVSFVKPWQGGHTALMVVNRITRVRDTESRFESNELTYLFHPLLPSGVEGVPESLPLLSILYCPFHLFPCYSFLSCHLL